MAVRSPPVLGVSSYGDLVGVTARRWFWVTFALFLASAMTVVVGWGTCTDESAQCAEWHQTLNFAAPIAAAVFLVLMLILALMIFVDAAVRRRSA